MNVIFRVAIIFLGLLLGWQLLVSLYHLPDYILPSPWQVFSTLNQQRIVILQQAWPTILETLLGFLFGIIFGCLAGGITAFYKSLRQWFLPILIISQAIPIFAIAPLLVIWLGFGIASKIATAVIMIFFPVASAFYDGLSKTPVGLLDLAKTMNASPWRTFWHIRIPAALPSLASGIRIAAVIAPMGAIVGEWVGASQGLGYLMINANARVQIDMMFAALFVIILLAIALYFCVDALTKKLVWW